MSKELQNTDNINFGNEEYTTDVDNATTGVASQKGSKIIMLIILGIIGGAIGFTFFGGEELTPQEKKELEEKKKKQESEDEEKLIPVPKAPIESLAPIIESIDTDVDEEVIVEVPEIEVPELPPMQNIEINLPKTEDVVPQFKAPKKDITDLEKSEISLPQENLNVNAESEETTEKRRLSPIERRRARRLSESNVSSSSDNISIESSPSSPSGPTGATRSKEYVPMMLMSSPGATEYDTAEEQYNIAPSSASVTEATQILNRERKITQGKMLEAVLETAINTDFDGDSRAIISRDIYADSGRSILIPKGSKLLGSYSGSTTSGQTRVLISWNRLIRPDGIDIQINANVTDQFGRAGVAGNVDNKYLEIFNNSMLLSLITVGAAIALDGLTGDSDITVEDDDSDDSTTTSGTASAFAAEEILDNLTTSADTIVTDLLNVDSTITVPQGTRVNVLVNSDLLFPPQLSNSDSFLMIE